MSGPLQEQVKRLRRALDVYRFDAVDDVCDAVERLLRADPSHLETKPARQLLGQLRRKRRFRELERLSALFLAHGLDDALVLRLRAQALIDSGQPANARVGLRTLCARVPASEHEGAEARGLLGRAAKQQYVDGGARDEGLVREAIAAYREVYALAPDEHIWHGINVVACAARAQREGHPIPDVDWRGIAVELLKVVDERETDRTADTWTYATGLEACVALGRFDDAMQYAKRYVQSDHADAFELGSTSRQLRELWHLDRCEGWAPVLALVHARALAQVHGRVDAPTAPAPLPLEDDGTLEARFGPETARSLRWLRKGLNRSLGVARLEVANGASIGTGFVVDAERVFDAAPGTVLLTCAHVARHFFDLDDDCRPREPMFADFTAIPGPGEEHRHRVERVLAYSPPDVFDAAVLALAPGAEVPRLLPTNRATHIRVERPSGTRVVVIGHPAGREMAYSLYDNLVHERDAHWLRYRSATERGSSGSPVFDDNWDTVAMHRGTNPSGTANIAVTLDAVADTLRGEMARRTT